MTNFVHWNGVYGEKAFAQIGKKHFLKASKNVISLSRKTLKLTPWGGGGAP